MFAAEILAYMAGELRWIREKAGEERGPRTNVAQERENEERNDREEDDMERLCERNRYRQFVITMQIFGRWSCKRVDQIKFQP